MTTRTRFPWLLAAMLLIAGLGPVPASLAVEQSSELLAGLRDRGYYDMAEAYLEQMRTSPLAPEEFKATIDYELGVTLIESCRAERLSSRKTDLLNRAQELLEKFVKEQSKHKLVPLAQTQLANVIVERGKVKAEASAKPGTPEATAKQLLEEARGLYSQAQKVFEEAEARFEQQHKKFPRLIDQDKDAEQYEAREAVRDNLLSARLSLGLVVEEIAKTYPAGSKEAKEKYAAAAAIFKDLFDKYPTRLAGLYAKTWEGRCLREVGTPEAMKKAYDAFETIIMMPATEPVLRRLRNQTIVLLLETYLLPSQKKYAEAVERVKKWQEDVLAQDENSADGLAVKFYGAQAAFELAKTDEKNRGTYVSAAKNWYRQVTKFRNPHKDDANARLLDPMFGTGPREEPQTYDEARDRGNECREQLVAAQTQLDVARSQKQPENPELVKQVEESRADALRYYRMALGMATPETNSDELNTIRYYLAFLYFNAGDMYRAAVTGEFLAKRYPNSPGGKPGAQIAMIAYLRLIGAGQPGEDLTFENGKLTEVANILSERWPNDPEAAEAILMLIRSAVLDGELDKAAALLEKVAPDSPKRGSAELMVGQSLWADYLKKTRLPEGDRPRQDELNAKLTRAREILTAGVERLKAAVEAGEPVSKPLAVGVLSLAQMAVASGDAEQALPWLDDPKVGVVTLVEAKNPALAGDLAVEVYKAALRAYVAAQQLDKAEATMNALERLVGQDGQGGARLTQIYISLGKELQDQIMLLRDDPTKTAQLGKVLQGFGLFLDRIAARSEGNTFSSLNWVAETFNGLGSGLDPGGKELPPKAREYYEKAAETYKGLLASAADPAFGAPQNAEESVKIRLASVYRRLGQYDAAMDLLVGILVKRNQMINAQIEAAYTYQAWGQQKPAAYELAMKGGKRAKKPDGSEANVVWGWGKIANLVMRDRKYMPVFHEARYNLALCRLMLALSQKDAERKETLERAEQDVLIIQKLYPDLGGDEWAPKYNDLYKKIQQLQGKKPTGLPTPSTPVAQPGGQPQDSAQARPVSARTR